MKKILLIFGIIFVSCNNASEATKIEDICQWHHAEIIGWYENYRLFSKRLIEVSDKNKYPDSDNKTIERYLLKQKKLLEAIDDTEKKLQSMSKVYHYLECNRYERKFEKNR